MSKRSRTFKAGVSAAAILLAAFGIFGFRKLAVLAADPVGEKDCRPTSSEPGGIDLDRVKAIAPLADVTWSQLGGSINVASCLNTPS
jgi:hypothetical protein